MLELIKVSKRIGNDVHIRDVSLELLPGSLNVLLGATLSGKTTLMRLMAGLESPSTGEIRFNGVNVRGIPVQKRDVAMVYQQFINYPSLTVYENIASPLRVAGLDKATIRQRVHEAADLLRLGDYLQRLPADLSGGQQQRTALARALVKQAKLVLLDEPLANLDYKLREELRRELPGIFAKTGAILVYASTEPSEALLLGGNTATLHEGGITQFGPAIEVFQRPVDLQTARIFSDPPLNTLPVSKQGTELRCDDLVMTLPFQAAHAAHLPDGQYTLAIRPWHLLLDVPQKIAEHMTEEQMTYARLNAHVEVTEITGSETYVHVRLQGAQTQRWVALVHGVKDLPADSPLRLAIDPAQIYLFDSHGKRCLAPTQREDV
ncbi:MAG: ABC transporter ATP-binding protein [Pseudohongiella sp.]|nr:ABC transporter ATP-binding protein [Pseudohongiella sp.]